MTLEELKAIKERSQKTTLQWASQLVRDRLVLIAEVERLRGVLKKVVDDTDDSWVAARDALGGAR